jgi:actin-related protein 9
MSAMSSIGFRDSSVIIIETSRTVIRGGLGLHELLRTPTIVRVSLPQFAPSDGPHTLLVRKSKPA